MSNPRFLTLVSKTKATSSINKKVNITWRITKSSRFIYNLLDRDNQISNRKRTMSNHCKFILEINHVSSRFLGIERREASPRFLTRCCRRHQRNDNFT